MIGPHNRRRLSLPSQLGRDESGPPSCLPLIERKLTFAPGRLPFTERKLPDIERKLPDIERKLPDIARKLPVVERKLPDVERKLPDVEGKLPDVEGKLPLDVRPGMPLRVSPCTTMRYVRVAPARPDLPHQSRRQPPLDAEPAVPEPRVP